MQVVMQLPVRLPGSDNNEREQWAYLGILYGKTTALEIY